MDYENLVISMLEAIPEIKPFYDEELDWWDEILPHIVFGDVFNPFLINLLGTNLQEELVKRIFHFLEVMATCTDEKVKEVLAVTVLERLGGEPNIKAKATHYMGNITRSMSIEVEKGWEHLGVWLKESNDKK